MLRGRGHSYYIPLHAFVEFKDPRDVLEAVDALDVRQRILNIN